MEYLRVLCTSVISVCVLFLLAKLLGYRQISDLSVFDYINSITIGSIAGALATVASFREAGFHLIAMLVFALGTLLLAHLTNRSRKFRSWVTGRELPLLEAGRLRRHNLARAKMDLHELLTQCRAEGYFRLDELAYICLLPSGKLGILPKSTDRPATPKDLCIPVSQAGIAYAVITDGEIDSFALKATGIDTPRLMKLLREKGYRSPSEVFYAELTPDGSLTAFPMEEGDQ